MPKIKETRAVHMQHPLVLGLRMLLFPSFCLAVNMPLFSNVWHCHPYILREVSFNNIDGSHLHMYIVEEQESTETLAFTCLCHSDPVVNKITISIIHNRSLCKSTISIII